jgi:CheY-like chemotaxis protein
LPNGTPLTFLKPERYGPGPARTPGELACKIRGEVVPMRAVHQEGRNESASDRDRAPLDVGACSRMWLRASALRRTKDGACHLTMERPTRPPLKVMLVDDDPTTLQVHAAILEQLGHSVTQRATALGTTLAILRDKPDVIVLDVRMPGLTGDKLASLISAEADGNRLVILHSSLPIHDLERVARECGANAAIEKTGDPGAFAKRFEQLVSSWRMTARRRAGATVSKP